MDEVLWMCEGNPVTGAVCVDTDLSYFRASTFADIEALYTRKSHSQISDCHLVTGEYSKKIELQCLFLALGFGTTSATSSQVCRERGIGRIEEKY